MRMAALARSSRSWPRARVRSEEQGVGAHAADAPAAAALPSSRASLCGVPQPVIDGYWDWELGENRGAAFSTFATEDVRVSRARPDRGRRARRDRDRRRRARGPEQRAKRLALALIAGGALGNLVDRVRNGAVTDFVRWHLHASYVADLQRRGCRAPDRCGVPPRRRLIVRRRTSRRELLKTSRRRRARS